MPGMRSYGDPCGIARALDVIGERWASLIVRELLLGPKRFTDLRADLGTSPNVLTQRLAELESAGIVVRKTSGGPVYELSAWGKELHPILLQLGRWGARSQHRPTAAMSVDATLLALQSCFEPERALDLDASYELRLEQRSFWVEIRQGKFAVGRGNAPSPDVIIECDAETLRATALGDKKLGDQIRMQGDAKAGRAFFRLFARPRAG